MKILFICLGLIAISQAQKLNIEVLYESLCPDSLNFIKNQLYPTWKEVAPFVNIKFVPFGKSISFNGGADFDCQHGPRECMGNRIQSCALNALPEQSAQVEFVNCFMRTFRKNDEKEFGQSCIINSGLNWDAIRQCYGSSVGTELQLLAEQQTLKTTPRFVPTILYNGVFNQQAQDDSLQDFRGVICSFIAPTHPDACKSPAVLHL